MWSSYIVIRIVDFISDMLKNNIFSISQVLNVPSLNDFDGETWIFVIS